MKQPFFFTAIWLTGLAIMFAPGTQAKQYTADIADNAYRPRPVVISIFNADQQTRQDDESGNGQSPNGDASVQWVLVIVTSITAGLICWQAWETRRAAQAAADSVGEIKRQADIMESQKGVLEQSVKAAEDNAAAAKEQAIAANRNIEMLVNKERARVRIAVKPLNLSTPQFGAYLVEFTVANCGSSTAFIANSGCVAYFGPKQSVEIDTEWGGALVLPIHSMPNDIAPNGPPLERFAILFGIEEKAALTEVREDRFSVGVRGFIKYRDVFQQDRETAFRYIWRLSPIRGVLAGDPFSGDWIECGSPEENNET